MTDEATIKYNYDVFKRENFEPLMQWDNTPSIGEKAPDFPLWHLDETETSLSALCAQHTFLVVEFGSFT